LNVERVWGNTLDVSHSPAPVTFYGRKGKWRGVSGNPKMKTFYDCHFLNI